MTKERDFAALKAFIAGREFDIGQSMFGLVDGKDNTSHDQPCPFCGGKDRFHFYPDKGTYHCRNDCRFSGDIFDLAAKKFNVSITEAYDIVAEAAGYVDGVVHTKTGENMKKIQDGKKTEYPYINEDGKECYRITRTDFIDKDGEAAKKFCPSYRDKDGKPVYKEPPILYPYNLMGILEAKTVFIVEGEKTANCLNDALQSAKKGGVIATTSQGGSKRGKLWKIFLERYPEIAEKKIRILPDNDNPGMEYARTVAAAFLEANPDADVKIVLLPGLPEGGDFVDWYATNKNRKENE